MPGKGWVDEDMPGYVSLADSAETASRTGVCRHDPFERLTVMINLSYSDQQSSTDHGPVSVGEWSKGAPSIGHRSGTPAQYDLISSPHSLIPANSLSTTPTSGRSLHLDSSIPQRLNAMFREATSARGLLSREPDRPVLACVRLP